MKRLAWCLISILILSVPAGADDWSQWLGTKRDGVWREEGILKTFPKGGPKKLWDVPIGSGYAGPAVANGKVFVMDRHLAKEAKVPGNAFSTAKVDGTERLLGLNVKNGHIDWKVEYPCTYGISYASGPRCTPTVDGDRAYFLGAMGHLHCCDTTDGRVIWKKNFVKNNNASIPVWGFAAHPLIDGDQLICLVGGPDDHLVISFDKKTGKELWHSLSCPGDFGYCPPMIYTFDGRRQLIIWHSKAVNGLDPATGKLLWTVPFESKSALTVPTPRLVSEDRLFLTSFYKSSMLLKVKRDSAEIVWKGAGKGERPNQTTDVQSIMTTPAIDGKYAYSVCSYGELRCIDVTTGARIWATNKATRGRLTPPAVAKVDTPSESQPWVERWANAFIIPHEDRDFIFNEQGELIIAKLSAKGYEEIDRAVLINPDNKMAGRPVVWMHPAFADKKIFVRNDSRIICYDLAK